MYPAQQIHPCSGTRYGEVVSIIAAPGPTVVRGPADGRYLEDPNLGGCYLVALRYLGMTTQPVLRYWQPNLQFTAALSRPSPRQEAAGQHWAACIVKPTGVMYAGPPDQQYGSSIRDALHTGRERDQLGSCVPTDDRNAGGGGSYCGGPITTAQVPAHSYLVCGVTPGSRKLRGSLIALGQQPIPLA